MPLVSRQRNVRQQWAVVTGSLIIGSISKNTLSVVVDQEVAWDWTLSVSAAPPGFHHHGRGGTFKEAKEQVERNWRIWCEAAGLQERKNL